MSPSCASAKAVSRSRVIVAVRQPSAVTAFPPRIFAYVIRPDLLLDDQVHPVPEGGELYAQTVTDAVAALRRQPAS